MEDVKCDILKHADTFTIKNRKCLMVEYVKDKVLTSKIISD